MPNYAKRPVRYDQSKNPRHRVPSRDAERGWWEIRKQELLPLIERGFSSTQIADQITRTSGKSLSAVTVRSNIQRLYNEAGLIKRRRNTASLLRQAYALGWLPCPCGKEHGSPTGKDHRNGTTEERG